MPLQLRPTLPGDVTTAYRDAVHALVALQATVEPDYASFLRHLPAALERRTGWPELEAVVSVLVDLLQQGWTLDDADGLCLSEPAGLEADEAVRAQVRAQEQLKRAEQLRSPSVRGFVRGMERRRLHDDSFTSIFSLMRDGRHLVRLIEERGAEVPLQPYVQEVVPGTRCEHSGLDLQDIWRYFRHTWSNQYTSVPGRSMSFLVRDAAAPCHPVVGIFTLSSAVVQIGIRDVALGWHPDVVVERLRSAREPELAVAIRSVIERGIADLYLDDFIDEGELTPRDVSRPSLDLVQRLRVLGTAAREQHTQSPDRTLKASSEGADEAFWRARACSTLFRSKRALQLAELLEARLVLTRHLPAAVEPDDITSLLSDPDGVRAVRRLARRQKAERVGIALADLAVCGAVPPYSHLLGGKLIAMLAASPPVVRAYQRRYGAAASEIASAMAGRPVVRTPSLVFVGTTSLYGVGLNQYTRVAYPCEELGGRGRVRYRKLGRSEAYGTSQYSSRTVSALARAAERATGRQRVNNIFGEGTSPKLRLIRDGLDSLDLPVDDLLRHGRSRIVYGVELTLNTSRYLLGLDDAPEYRFSLDDEVDSTATITDYWWRRWVHPRLQRADLLERVRRETKVRPIRHGARVVLPPGSDQALHLFGDLWD